MRNAGDIVQVVRESTAAPEQALVVSVHQYKHEGELVTWYTLRAGAQMLSAQEKDLVPVDLAPGSPRTWKGRAQHLLFSVGCSWMDNTRVDYMTNELRKVYELGVADGRKAQRELQEDGNE